MERTRVVANDLDEVHETTECSAAEDVVEVADEADDEIQGDELYEEIVGDFGDMFVSNGDTFWLKNTTLHNCHFFQINTF